MLVNKLRKYGRFARRLAMPDGIRLGLVGGAYGYLNLGDEALLLATARLFPRCTLIELPRKRLSARLASRLIPVRHALLAGGTLMNQHPIWLDLMRLYVPAMATVIVFGTGVGHPTFWGDRRREWAPLLARCGYVGVRGPISRDLLIEAGVTGVDVIGDPVLTFAQDDCPDAGRAPTATLGLNIGWDGDRQWGQRENIWRETAALASLARAAGWSVKWLVVCPNDYELTQRLAQTDGAEVRVVCQFNDPHAYMREVQTCSVLVGTRLHAVVLGTCAYVPSLMLEYQVKCRDFMLSIGHGHRIIRTDQFTARETWKLVEAMHAERKAESAALHEKIGPIRRRQQAMADELQSRMARV